MATCEICGLAMSLCSCTDDFFFMVDGQERSSFLAQEEKNWFEKEVIEQEPLNPDYFETW